MPCNHPFLSMLGIFYHTRSKTKQKTLLGSLKLTLHMLIEPHYNFIYKYSYLFLYRSFRTLVCSKRIGIPTTNQILQIYFLAYKLMC